MATDKYISLDDAIKLLRKAETGYRKTMVSQVRADMIAHCIKLICEIPAADVRTVVHGKWSRVDYEPCGHDYICSECGCKSDGAWNFCHGCGADMRETGR